MEKVKISHLNISITIWVRSENSSDLDTGRRPELKSDEFSDLTHIVIEILRCEIFTFSIHTSINRSMSPCAWALFASVSPQ